MSGCSKAAGISVATQGRAQLGTWLSSVRAVEGTPALPRGSGDGDVDGLAKPAWVLEMTSWTPERLRVISDRRKAEQVAHEAEDRAVPVGVHTDRDQGMCVDDSASLADFRGQCVDPHEPVRALFQGRLGKAMACSSLCSWPRIDLGLRQLGDP